MAMSIVHGIPVLMKNLLTFESVYLPKRIFLRNLDRPLIRAFFKMYYDGMYSSHWQEVS